MYALLFLLAACGSPDCPDCPVCKECPPAPAHSLEDWEADILQPLLDQLRDGIALHGDEAFGICRGKRECDEFIGTSPSGPLPGGDFFIRAELEVPPIGEDWKVQFQVQCELTNPQGNSSTQNHDKIYSVKYAGKGRGYRLQPLWKIQSPHPNGERKCDFSLTPIRPDAQKGEPWTGSYSTAMP